jgi:hypothetical protein
VVSTTPPPLYPQEKPSTHCNIYKYISKFELQKKRKLGEGGKVMQSLCRPRKALKIPGGTGFWILR